MSDTAVAEPQTNTTTFGDNEAGNGVENTPTVAGPTPEERQAQVRKSKMESYAFGTKANYGREAAKDAMAEFLPLENHKGEIISSTSEYMNSLGIKSNENTVGLGRSSQRMMTAVGKAAAFGAWLNDASPDEFKNKASEMGMAPPKDMSAAQEEKWMEQTKSKMKDKYLDNLTKSYETSTEQSRKGDLKLSKKARNLGAGVGFFGHIAKKVQEKGAMTLLNPFTYTGAIVRGVAGGIGGYVAGKFAGAALSFIGPKAEGFLSGIVDQKHIDKAKEVMSLKGNNRRQLRNALDKAIDLGEQKAKDRAEDRVPGTGVNEPEQQVTQNKTKEQDGVENKDGQETDSPNQTTTPEAQGEDREKTASERRLEKAQAEHQQLTEDIADFNEMKARLEKEGSPASLATVKIIELAIKDLEELQAKEQERVDRYSALVEGENKQPQPEPTQAELDEQKLNEIQARYPENDNVKEGIEGVKESGVVGKSEPQQEVAPEKKSEPTEELSLDERKAQAVAEMEERLNTHEPTAQQVKAELEKLKEAREEAIGREDYETAAVIKGQEATLFAYIDEQAKGAEQEVTTEPASEEVSLEEVNKLVEEKIAYAEANGLAEEQLAAIRGGNDPEDVALEALMDAVEEHKEAARAQEEYEKSPQGQIDKLSAKIEFIEATVQEMREEFPGSYLEDEHLKKQLRDLNRQKTALQDQIDDIANGVDGNGNNLADSHEALNEHANSQEVEARGHHNGNYMDAMLEFMGDDLPNVQISSAEDVAAGANVSTAEVGTNGDIAATMHENKIAANDTKLP